MTDCTPNPLTCYSSYDFIGEARPHRFPAFACFTDYSPVIPTFYWDVKTQEQRIKEICCTLQKAIKYTEALGEEYATVYNALIEFKEGILTAFEQYKTQLNNEFENFKNDVNADQTAFENEIRQIQSTFEANITQRQNDFENLQTERQDVFENRITLRQTNFEEAQRTRQENFENDINEHITQFETEMGNRADAFEAAQRQRQNEFEQKINTEWSDYQSNLNAAWAAYQQAMNQAWDAWKTETGNDLDKYKTDLIAEWGEFRESQITAYNQLRTEWENWRQDQESFLTDWKDQTLSELNEWKTATIAEFNKTFEDYQAEIKRLYGDQISFNTDRIEMLETSQAEQDGKITALETSQAEQDGKITALETSDIAQNTRLNDVETKAEMLMDDVQGTDTTPGLITRVTDVENKAATNADNITSLDSRIDALETNGSGGGTPDNYAKLTASVWGADEPAEAFDPDLHTLAQDAYDNADTARNEISVISNSIFGDTQPPQQIYPPLETQIKTVNNDVQGLDGRLETLETAINGDETTDPPVTGLREEVGNLNGIINGTSIEPTKSLVNAANGFAQAITGNPNATYPIENPIAYNIGPRLDALEAGSSARLTLPRIAKNKRVTHLAGTGFTAGQQIYIINHGREQLSFSASTRNSGNQFPSASMKTPTSTYIYPKFSIEGASPFDYGVGVVEIGSSTTHNWTIIPDLTFEQAENMAEREPKFAGYISFAEQLTEEPIYNVPIFVRYGFTKEVPTQESWSLYFWFIPEIGIVENEPYIPIWMKNVAYLNRSTLAINIAAII